jgi:hypothetical protein
MLDCDLAEAPHLCRVEPVSVLDADRHQPHLRCGVAFGDMNMRWLDPIAGVEREAEAFDPKERRHARVLLSTSAPPGPLPAHYTAR